MKERGSVVKGFSAEQRENGRRGRPPRHKRRNNRVGGRSGGKILLLTLLREINMRV